MTSFIETKDKVLAGVLALLCAGAVTWCGWVTVTLGATASPAEVRSIVATESPYAADRKHLQAEIERFNVANREILKAVKVNNDAINSLRIEIISRLSESK